MKPGTGPVSGTGQLALPKVMMEFEPAVGVGLETVTVSVGLAGGVVPPGGIPGGVGDGAVDRLRHCFCDAT